MPYDFSTFALVLQRSEMAFLPPSSQCLVITILQGLAQMLPITDIIFFHLFSFTGGQLLYSITMVSAIHQHELAIGIHMSPPS